MDGVLQQVFLALLSEMKAIVYYMFGHEILKGSGVKHLPQILLPGHYTVCKSSKAVQLIEM